MATALATLMSQPAVELAPHRPPVDRLGRLEQALGPNCPRLLMKRDDLLGFGLGGNKVRKLQMLAAEALRQGADTLITCGAAQSNHARVTAAAGAVLGLRVVLVLHGTEPDRPTGNLFYDHLFGADIRFVPSPTDREAAMTEAAEDARRAGHRPFVIPVGGSTPIGAMGVARAIAELAADGVKPDVIVHASSSAGTQAGLTAGCALFGSKAAVVGISADEPASALSAHVEQLISQMALQLGARVETLLGSHPIDVDDQHIGGGYGVPTHGATEAIELVARTQGIVLDPVYTAKAMAGLIAHVRSGRYATDRVVLFWHTGGWSGPR